MTLAQRVMMGASGAAAFDPGEVYIWLDAADSRTITQSSGAVTGWQSKGSYTGTFSTATSANSPQTGARTINGLNALDFDNANSEALVAGTLSLATSGQWTGFVVAETDTTSGILPILGSDSTTIRYGQLLRRNSTTLQSIGFTSVSAAITDSAPGTIATSTPYIFETYSTGSTIEALLNGSGDGAASGAQRSATPQMWVGGDPQGASTVPVAWWNGAIAEVLWYNTALSSDNRTSVRGYLADRWGITL